MALGPITKPRKRQKIAAYDLEWDTESGKLTLAGLLIRGKYCAFGTAEKLLSAMFEKKNTGYFFYAHSGGRHDMAQLATALRATKHSVECHVVGSRIILAIVKPYESDGTVSKKVVWYLADSLAVLKSSLEDIGKSIGLEKILGDTDDMSQAELFRRNKRDCEIVVTALEKAQSFLWKRGGELHHTVGACGMSLIRRAYHKDVLITRKDDNLWAREAYHAARVEVFRYRDENGLVRDINSAFPWAITQGLPGERVRIDKTIPDTGGFWCADVMINVPDGFCPPIPKRVKNRIYFPVGRFRARITRVMFELLHDYARMLGHSTDNLIEDVYEVHHYQEGLQGFGNYIRDMYRLRKATQDAYEKLLYKYLMNTCYGKLAERGEKNSLQINPEDLPPIETEVCPGVYKIPTFREVAHEHVIAAVWITDQAKALITRELWKYGELAAYCDTDCVHGPDLGFPSSEELGAFKHEDRYTLGERVAPKLYCLWTGVPRLPKIVAKGFSKPNYDEFCKLREGYQKEFEWFATPREAWRGEKMVSVRKKGLTRQCPVCYKHLDFLGGCSEHDNASELAVLVSGKRKILRDGTTRPWHVSELR